MRSRSYYNFLNKYLRHYLDAYVDREEMEAAGYERMRFDTARSLFSGKTQELIMAEVVISALSFGDFGWLSSFMRNMPGWLRVGPCLWQKVNMMPLQRLHLVCLHLALR